MKPPLIILQARLNSRRLPKKVLLPINDRPMIAWQIDRIRSARVGELVVATSTDVSDDDLCIFLSEEKISFRRGPVDDVVSRFSNIIDEFKPDYFFRLTADCPLIMPNLMKEMVEIFSQGDYDYVSNTHPPTYPDGLDLEVIKTSAFKKMQQLDLTAQHKEHVTLAIYENPSIFSTKNVQSKIPLQSMRWTVDYPEDYEFIKNIYLKFAGRELEFEIDDILLSIENGEIQKNMISSELRNISLKESSDVK